MRAKLQELIRDIKLLTSPLEIRTTTVSTIRIVLQHACIALAEGIVASRKKDHFEYLESFNFEQLRSPADGTLLAALSELLIVAEKLGWNGISAPFIKDQVDKSRPCFIFSRSKSPTLETILQGLVNFRNDGELGHGLPGNYDSRAEIDVLEYTVEKLSNILPVIQSDDSLVIKLFDNSPYIMQLLKVVDGNLMCYRKISKLLSGRCQVRGQVQTGLKSRENIVYEAPDILGVSEARFPQYRIISTCDKNWTPFAILPEKLTNDFVGRDTELGDLLDWFNDTGSRACMLYGDGGIGKTTLTLEFLHRVIEGEIRPNWRPEVITFFTAKQTRWGLKGLEYIQTRPVGITELAVEIIRGLSPAELDRSWYSIDDPALINKLAAFLNEWGIDRKSHLIILDNTETMIKSEEELKNLAKNIRELSRRVGRILITSRRREAIEANQIEILPFDVEESVKFLKKRADILDRKQILQAGVPRLRQLANKMGNKPLVLEVFVHALGEPGISLDRALDRVIQMQRQDLGEFLYSDAWKRLSENMKHLLLLMTRIGDMHDEFQLKLCCIQVGVSVLEANDALEESKGIAAVTRIEDHLQIVFNPSFMKYCEGITVNIAGLTLPTQQAVDTVKRRYTDFLKGISTRIYDRVSKAYRHPLARAAHKAFQEQRFEDCELFYEEAVVADSTNGWLYDRYAYFLFTLKRLNEAHDKSRMATQLLPKDPETWFTRGIIESRIEGFSTIDAIGSLDKACSLGKEEHLCLLQKVHAYLNDVPPNKALARAMLDESERKTPTDHPKAWKHKEEIRIMRIRMGDVSTYSS